MRVIGALVVGLIMYIAVPLLWQHVMVAKVNETSAKNPVAFPVSNVAETSYSTGETSAGQRNPPVAFNYPNSAAQQQADESVRQGEAAADRDIAAMQSARN